MYHYTHRRFRFGHMCCLSFDEQSIKLKMANPYRIINPSLSDMSDRCQMNVVRDFRVAGRLQSIRAGCGEIVTEMDVSIWICRGRP